MRKVVLSFVAIMLVPCALTVGKNPAIRRLQEYIVSNNVTEAQIQAATAAQAMAVMYPDSPGHAPYYETPGDGDNYVTPARAKQHLRDWYRDYRFQRTWKPQVQAFVASAGWTVVSVERSDGPTTDSADHVTVVMKRLP